ncbi:unnamed protein product [Closterium sp. NIES-64]|nr:unnamed protein product [Closterium sp. NIES-64]
MTASAPKDPNRFLTSFHAALVACSSEAAVYGRCVAARVPGVDKAVCEKEFLQLKTCFYASDESSPVVLGPRPLLRFDVPGAAGVMYDEPHGILLVSAHEKVYAWRVPTPAQEQQSLEQYIQQQQQLNHCNSHAHAHTPGHSRTHSVSHGHLQPVQQPAPQVFAISDRPVLAVRFSLDGRILAVQRSAHELELLLRRPSSSSSSSSTITTTTTSTSTTPTAAAAASSGGSGAEASGAAAAGAAGAGGSGSGQVVMRMVEAWRVAIGWYVYTHESRVLILAAGPRFCSLTAIQFSAAGLVKLPKFTAQLGTSAAPTTTSTHSLTAKPAPPVVLAPQDVRIANMYGRIYCVQVDRVSSLLHIFRFFRDAIVLQVSIPLPSTRVAVSVADNLLLVHLPAIHRLLLFDPLLNHWKPICPALAPAFAPLSSSLPPSLTPSFPRTLSRSSTVCAADRSSLFPLLQSRRCSRRLSLPPALTPPSLPFPPSLAIFPQSLAVCAADRSSLFPLLQRRRCNRQQVHAICLSLFSDLLAQRSPLPTLSSAFSSLLSAYATALAAAARKPKPVQDTPGASSAVAAGTDASSRRSSSSSGTVAAKQEAGEGESAEQQQQQQVGANDRTASGGFFHVAAESGAVSETAVSGGDGGLGEALEGRGGAGAGGGTGGEVGGREPATLSRTSSVASVGEGLGGSAARGGGVGGGGGGEAEAADPAVEEDEGVVSPEHLLHQIELHLEACTQQTSRHRSTPGGAVTSPGESSRGDTRREGEAGGDGGGGEKGEEEGGVDGGCGEKEMDGGAAACGAVWHDSSYTVGVLVELIRCMDDLRLPLPAFLRAQSSLVRLLAAHHLWAALLHLLSAKVESTSSHLHLSCPIHLLAGAGTKGGSAAAAGVAGGKRRTGAGPSGGTEKGGYGGTAARHGVVLRTACCCEVPGFDTATGVLAARPLAARMPVAPPAPAPGTCCAAMLPGSCTILPRSSGQQGRDGGLRVLGI